MDRLPSNTRRLLNAAHWERLWLQCLLYAAHEEKRHGGAMHRSRDMVQTAIERTFSGDRVWDPEKCDLLRHLRMTIKSLYSSAHGRRMSRLKYRQLSLSDDVPAASPSRAQEDLDYLRKAVATLRRHDPALAEFFITACHHLTTDCDTDREVAAAMNIAPSRFNKTKARISGVIGNWDTEQTRKQAK